MSNFMIEGTVIATRIVEKDGLKNLEVKVAEGPNRYYLTFFNHFIPKSNLVNKTVCFKGLISDKNKLLITSYELVS